MLTRALTAERAAKQRDEQQAPRAATPTATSSELTSHREPVLEHKPTARKADRQAPAAARKPDEANPFKFVLSSSACTMHIHWHHATLERNGYVLAPPHELQFGDVNTHKSGFYLPRYPHNLQCVAQGHHQVHELVRQQSSKVRAVALTLPELQALPTHTGDKREPTELMSVYISTHVKSAVADAVKFTHLFIRISEEVQVLFVKPGCDLSDKGWCDREFHENELTKMTRYLEKVLERKVDDLLYQERDSSQRIADHAIRHYEASVSHLQSVTTLLALQHRQHMLRKKAKRGQQRVRSEVTKVDGAERYNPEERPEEHAAAQPSTSQPRHQQHSGRIIKPHPLQPPPFHDDGAAGTMVWAHTQQMLIHARAAERYMEQLPGEVVRAVQHCKDFAAVVPPQLGVIPRLQ
jgi:hypothetical protein